MLLQAGVLPVRRELKQCNHFNAVWHWLRPAATLRRISIGGWMVGWILKIHSTFEFPHMIGLFQGRPQVQLEFIDLQTIFSLLWLYFGPLCGTIANAAPLTWGLCMHV